MHNKSVPHQGKLHDHYYYEHQKSNNKVTFYLPINATHKKCKQNLLLISQRVKYLHHGKISFFFVFF